MAQLDTRLALGVAAPAIKTIGQARKEQMAITGDQQAIEMNEQNLEANRQRLKLTEDKAKRDTEGIEVLSELMATHRDDYDAITKGLAERGRADLVPSFATMHRANRLAALTNEEKELKIAQDKHKVLAQTLKTIKDPASFYGALGTAIQNKWLPLEKAQEYAQRGYNAEVQGEIDQLVQSSQTLEQQMDEYRKAQEEKRKELLFPIEKAGKELDNTKKKQETTGTVPMTEKDKQQMLTADQKEYDAAVKEGSFGGTLTDWIRARANDKAPRTTVNVGTAKENFKDEHTLRTEFNALPTVKAFNEVKTQAERARKAFNLAAEAEKAGTSANSADQILITVLNKVLDPTSVVRESEYARTADGQSVISRLSGSLDRMKRGGAGITSAERKSIMDSVGALENAMKENYAPVEGEYRQLAKEYGLKEDRVVRKSSGAEDQAATKRGGPLTFKTPDGKTREFDSQQQLDDFKKRAGLK